MIEQIKQLRVEIDGLAQLCEGLKPYKDLECGRILPSHNSVEILEAVKSLKLSKAWLGKVLESLGSENPYGSGYKTVEDIVPETDKVSLVDKMRFYSDYENNFKYKSHVEKVDWLRTEIKSQVQKLQKLHRTSLEGYSCTDLNTASKYLTEACFWLGFELGRVRDESK